MIKKYDRENLFIGEKVYVLAERIKKKNLKTISAKNKLF